jgi:peptide/nickel transport system substrate-binding protein
MLTLSNQPGKAKMLPAHILFRFVFLLLLFSACIPADQTGVKNRIVYGLTLEPSGFDPHINQSAEIGIVLRQVYDTLVYRDPATDEIVPGLAAEWVNSEDGLVYTFTLKQGVTFHDGTAVNAQAVAANLDRITNPETRSQHARFLLGPYEGYQVLDEYSIAIHLTEPYSPLLDGLAQIYLGIASPNALQEYSLNRYQFHQVGTGPYRFVEYVPGNRVVLQRNTDYTWGPSFYHPPTDASLDEIEFRFFTDPPTRSVALENDEVQVMGELPPVDARILAGNNGLKLLPEPIPGQPAQFLINTQRFPTDNLAVRQALLYGTNRNAIVDAVYQGFSPVAWGPLSEETLYYNPAVKGAYAVDTGQSQALLASAGYTDSDNNGVLDMGGVELEIVVLVPPWGLFPETAQLLQDQWRSLGIKTKLQPVPGFLALLEAVKSGEYNLVAFNTFGKDPAFLARYFSSDGTSNWTGFSSIELDNILREAMRQSDANVRGNLYFQAQRIIMEQALVLPIREYRNLNASSTNIQNLVFDAYGWFPLLNNATISTE